MNDGRLYVIDRCKWSIYLICKYDLGNIFLSKNKRDNNNDNNCNIIITPKNYKGMSQNFLPRVSFLRNQTNHSNMGLEKFVEDNLKNNFVSNTI